MYTLTSLSFKHVSNTRFLIISEQLQVWASTRWVMKFDWTFVGSRAWIATRLNSLSKSFIILRLVSSLVPSIRLLRHRRHTPVLLLLLRNIAPDRVAGRSVVLLFLVIATTISHLIVLLLELVLVSISISSFIGIHVTLFERRWVVITLAYIVTLSDFVGWS